MKKFIVDPEFWELFPQAAIHVLVVETIDNHVSEEKDAGYAELLANGKKEAGKFLVEETFSQNPVIEQWRNAFSQFKTKKGARSSIEALLKRVSQDRDFYPINPLVDMYNSVSMKYAVPCGGEDLEAISGDLHLGQAAGGESFFPLGAETDAPALPGEIIYFDEEGAVCRCLNWREAQRTMLQETTKQAVLVIEAINEEQNQRATQAMQELKELIAQHLGVEGKTYTATKEEPEVPLI
jgi:DNA/RNA-binding domain of Phe-tRNA-synthetase-like protein